MKIVVLSGSFHSRSKSLALADFLVQFLRDHDVLVPRLDALPFSSDDLNRDKPKIVRSFLQGIEAADGLLCCTPEYNHSIPAVLKNAIDWASRPAFNSPLKGKPVSFVTQAGSPVGGARAQAHLKLVFDSTLAIIHPCHEMMISAVDQIFDANMQLVDTKVQERLQRHAEDFVRFVSTIRH